MIDDVHAPVGRGTGRTVDAAVRERRVRYIVGRLKVVAELVKDVRGGAVGAVIYPWSVAHTSKVYGR
jgi:hypothetical protein